MIYFNLKFSYFYLLVFVVAGLTACTSQVTQSPVTTDTSFKLVSTTSLGPTSIELIFNQAVGASGSVPANYSIEGLTVKAAAIIDKTVTLTTLEQTDQDYALTIQNLYSSSGMALEASANSSTFRGNARRIKLLSANSTDRRNVRLVFSETVGASGNVAANYQIEGLRVEAASVKGSSVELRTSLQTNQAYVVKVTNIVSSGGASLDFNSSSASFDGPLSASSPVTIINLSQSFLTTDSCIKAGSREAIASCVEQRIRAVTPKGLTSFDVFVPGTAAEHGVWKQFNTMNLAVSDRAYLSLQYRHEGSPLNATLYDDSVKDGRASLIELLNTLKTRFPETKVRVFGHSKGSHIVAMVADEPSFSGMQFFAIAQPGRTAVDIDSRSDIKAAKLGDAGYIHKLSNNLIGITWLNDEVGAYTGKGYNGLMMPERWAFPGFIWQATTDGTLSAQVRIDHHNSYGGRYTDGLASNDVLSGDGSTKDNYPYCATGDKSAFDNGNECQKQDTHNSPFFWDNAECRDKAFEMMDAAAVGEKYYIGYSGPRSAGCQDNVAPIDVSYELEYRINIGDIFQADCRYEMRLAFEGLNSPFAPYTRSNGSSISVSTTSNSDTGWRKKTGNIRLPYHMRIYLQAIMTETSSGCYNPAAETEGYIRRFAVTFKHPDSQRSITRTLIGLEEGKGYITSLHKRNNVAWEQWDDPRDSRDTFKLYTNYSLTSWDGLKIEGKTDGDQKGHFYKQVHLID